MTIAAERIVGLAGTGVAHGALVAFDVQLDAGGEAVFGAVEVVAGADDAVARHGQEGAAQRVEVRGGRACRRGLRRAGRRCARPCPARRRCAAHARSATAGRVGWRLEVLGDVAADVGVGARVAGLGVARRAGVVDVVGGLLPGVEHHLLVGVVRVQRGDDALGRVVEQHRADADLRRRTRKPWRGAEEGLVLADRLALVVEDGPAAADPARVDDGRLRIVDVSGPGSAWIFFWISRPKPSE